MCTFAFICLAALVALISPGPAIAALVTYEIAGTVTSASLVGSAANPFTVGNPFSFAFSLDTAEQGSPGTSISNYGFASPPVLTVNGQTMNSLGLVVGDNGNLAVMSGVVFHGESEVRLGAFWLDPRGDGLFFSESLLLSPVLTSVSLQQLPSLTFADLSVPIALVATNGGPVFLNDDANEGLTGAVLSATSISVAPEPSTLALAALSFVALVAWRWRGHSTPTA